jgi:hypothetical protein
MAPPVLDQAASVWRFVTTTGNNRVMSEVYSAIWCSIIPVTSFRLMVPYAYESSHVVFVPRWLSLRLEDELHTARRSADSFGNIGPVVYTINGIRTFRAGGRQRIIYAKEKI